MTTAPPLPQAPEAEKALLGSILMHPPCLDDVTPLVRVGAFMVPAHDAVYEAAVWLHENARVVDAVTVYNRLKAIKRLDEIGGAAYLAELAQAVPTAAHASHYATIVRDAAMRRALIAAGTDVVRECHDPGESIEDLLSRAEQKMLAVRDSQGSVETYGIDELLMQAMERIDARKRGDYRTLGLRTGFPDLDTILGGMRGGELSILAARPGMGKTALALNIAERVSTDSVSEGQVVIASLEMSKLELIERLMCSRAKVNAHRARNGHLSRDEERMISEASASLAHHNRITVDDAASPTVSDLAAMCRRIKRKKGLAMVIIDYLQLIKPDDKREPRQEQVATISRRLKWLAKELEIPVLCLAQLNRQTEAGNDHRPKLSHLRESGAIEQDADVVMFVHRPAYYFTADQIKDAQQEASERENLNAAEVIIAKQRNGPLDTAELVWFPEYTRFESKSEQVVDWRDQGKDGFE